MTSSVIESTRRTGNDQRARRQHPTSDCDQESARRGELVLQFQRVRDEILPEMERIEWMLTRVVIAYGLEYCHLDNVATSFLALLRDVRLLLVESRNAVLRGERASSMLDAVRQDTTHSLKHFRDVITVDLVCEEATPVYRKLIATLIDFEAKTSRDFAAQSSTEAHAIQS